MPGTGNCELQRFDPGPAPAFNTPQTFPPGRKVSRPLSVARKLPARMNSIVGAAQARILEHSAALYRHNRLYPLYHIAAAPENPAPAPLPAHLLEKR
jgi:hypothetical protein